MAFQHLITFVRRLRGGLEIPDRAGGSDAALLERFLRRRDEAAFEALVRRHGPMVLGVCRRVLRHEADAEDAFQATFLVLLRRAAALHSPAQVGGWLHGVAYRTALEARRAAARRKAKESQVSNEPRSEATDDPWESIRPVLDQELTRLPDKYRTLLVLCDLDGKTRKEAAELLGLPEGTVASRLARARALLAKRLTRRGVTLSAGSLAAALCQQVVVAAVPMPLLSATTSAATLLAAGRATAGAISPPIAELTERVVKAMFLNNLRIPTAILMILVVSLSFGGLLFWAAAQPPDTPKQPALKAQAAAAPGKDKPLPAQAKKKGAIFKAPGSPTHDVALSPDGKILARAGNGGAELWDVASGKKLHTLKGQPHFYKVAFSPDGKILAAIIGDVRPDKFEVEVKLWDVATGTERFPVKGQRIKALSMAFSPDRKTLATSGLGEDGKSGAVKLWDMATGKEKMELGGAWGSLAFAPDGKTLAIGDSSVQLWDLTTGKKRVSLARKGDWVDVRPFAYSDVLGFSPDGKTLVSAGLHKGKDDPETAHAQLTLWDVATAKERATIAIPGYSAPNAPPVVFTADGKTLITAVWIFEDIKDENSGRVSVQQWDLATGKARATFWTPVRPGGDHPEAGHVVGFFYAALSADGKTVAWGGAEGDDKITGTAHVWEVQSLSTSPPKIPKKIEEKKKAAAEEEKDIKDLQGTWKLRAVEVNGRREDPKHLQTQMRVEGLMLTLDTPEGHKQQAMSASWKYPFASYRIDASRRPKTIDIVGNGEPFSSGKPSYISVKAIYMLEGDRLTICRGRGRTLPEGFVGSTIESEPRPAEFKTQPDDGLTLEIYERVTEREKAELTFSLQMPAQAIFVKPGEKKTVTLGIKRGKKCEDDVTLTFTDVPKGVTFEPAKPVSKHLSAKVEFTIQAAKDAVLGDFAVKVKGSMASGQAPENQLELSVDPAGEAAREQPGKPPRRYLRPSRQPFTGTFDFSMAADEIAHDGEVLSNAGGKLVMKSKDGTEHSYTFADKPQVSYQNATTSPESLKAGMIVRVTAKKAKPQEATRIEAVYAYGAFMAEYSERERQKSERERQKKEQQDIEHQKKVQQDVDHLQGTWLVVSSQTGDKKEPLESLKKKRVIIKGDHLTLAFGNEQSEKREGTIKIDPQTKSLDWVIPRNGDAAMKAIYELKGDDLKIGFGVDGWLRPTRFEMGQDQVGWLLVLKRE